MTERVVCPLGHGDCPETCTAHSANKYLKEEMKSRSGGIIDITQLSPQSIKNIMGRLSKDLREQLAERCQKENGETDQAEATD